MLHFCVHHSSMLHYVVVCRVQVIFVPRLLVASLLSFCALLGEL